jgi:hypothetical protein
LNDHHEYKAVLVLDAGLLEVREAEKDSNEWLKLKKEREARLN